MTRASTILDKRVANIYKHGDASSLEAILGAKTISDFIERMDLLSRIGNRDADIVRQVEAQKREVEEMARILNSQHAEQEKMTAELESQKDDLDSRLADKTDVLASLLQDISNMEAEEAARAARAVRNRGGGPKSGTLYDVLDGLSSYYGNLPGPGEYSDHGGSGHGVWLGGDAADFMCGDGATVYAAHSGTVTEIGYNRGGWTVVSGGGYETCYAHADPWTFVGQPVSGGQAIARTGSGFGHLHFELIDGGYGVPAGDYPAYF